MSARLVQGELLCDTSIPLGRVAFFTQSLHTSVDSRLHSIPDAAPHRAELPAQNFSVLRSRYEVFESSASLVCGTRVCGNGSICSIEPGTQVCQARRAGNHQRTVRSRLLKNEMNFAPLDVHRDMRCVSSPSRHVGPLQLRAKAATGRRGKVGSIRRANAATAWTYWPTYSTRSLGACLELVSAHTCTSRLPKANEFERPPSSCNASTSSCKHQTTVVIRRTHTT
jgi:hypothetical protein